MWEVDAPHDTVMMRRDYHAEAVGIGSGVRTASGPSRKLDAGKALPRTYKPGR